MSLHSSHLLQSLNVDCFSVLKWSYEKCIETLMSLNVNQIDKQKFLPIYQKVCTKALHQNNVWSDFAAMGLMSYKLNCVLLLLHIQYHMSSSQLHLQTQLTWMAETPHDIIELKHQTKLIKQYLQHCTQSSPSSIEQALNQLIKSCHMMMHNAVLLASQNKKLFIENQRQKWKWAQKQSYIAREGVLSGGKAQSLIEMNNNNSTATVEEAASGVRQRASPKCSVCSPLTHNAHTCPEHQSNVW